MEAEGAPQKINLRFRAIARCVTAAVLAGVLASVWTLFLSGGTRLVKEWSGLLLAALLLAPTFVLGPPVYGAWKQRHSRPMQAALSLHLTSLGSEFRSVARWVPAVVLAIALAPAWTVFFSGGLRAVTAFFLLMAGGLFLAPVSLLALLAYGVWKRRFSLPMQATLGLALILLWSGLWNLGIGTIAFPFDLESASPQATVRLPSNERLRVAWGGDRKATNYHVVSPDQRWAYDFVVEPAAHGSESLDDYGCYGTPVVAPVTSTVHIAKDGAPDEIPGKASGNAANPTGNTVVLKLDTGTYLLIGHLKPGSVMVQAGDEVTEGDPIGECGNSGNTGEPHIHIHHQRQDPKRYPLNYAEGLPLYFRDHDGPPMPTGGYEMRDGNPVLTGMLVQHVGATPNARRRSLNGRALRSLERGYSKDSRSRSASSLATSISGTANKPSNDWKAPGSPGWRGTAAGSRRTPSLEARFPLKLELNHGH